MPVWRHTVGSHREVVPRRVGTCTAVAAMSALVPLSADLEEAYNLARAQIASGVYCRTLVAHGLGVDAMVATPAQPSPGAKISPRYPAVALSWA